MKYAKRKTHKEFVNNNIKLIEIPYIRKDELIKETIMRILNE